MGDFYPNVPREIELHNQGVEALRAKGFTVAPLKAAAKEKGNDNV
jgi:hypothetical protein